MRFIKGVLLLLVCSLAYSEVILPDPLRLMLAKYMRFTNHDVRQVKRGEVVNKALESQSKNELVFFGIIHTNAPAALLVKKFRDIETFKKGEAVLKVKKLSDPPVRTDFDSLVLEKEDLKELEKCRPGKCDMKLSTEMVARIRNGVDWEAKDHAEKVNKLYRDLLFEYVQAYLAGGNASLIEYHDKAKPVSLKNEFSAIIKGSRYINEKLPEFSAYLSDYPNKRLDGVENFLYWSKETLKFRPVITITHVTIYRANSKEAFFASKQIYANHYLTGSLAITGLISQNGFEKPGFYMFYLNRTRTDMLGGLLGGLKRSIARSRSTAALEENLTEIKNRLENEE